MDLEMENRIAAILMKEAAKLRRQAANDGIDAYLRPPNVRGRPNSRFLTATVLGVQQSNRAVEVNEMWRARQKEKELDDLAKKDERKRSRSYGSSDSQRNKSIGIEGYERKRHSQCSSSRSTASEDELRDNEIEEFLHSRAKRSRGAVGSRMDETGPYLPDSKGDLVSPNDIGYRDGWENCAILGPEKPQRMKSISSSDEESSEGREKRTKRVGSSKHHCRKHKSKDNSKDKKKREKKRSKHRKTILSLPISVRSVL